MIGQRYYSPELCMFIQPADVSSIDPYSINGLNLYSFDNNNPIGIAYRSSGSGASGGMVSSIASSVGGLNSGYHGTISNSSNILGALGATAFGTTIGFVGAFVIGGGVAVLVGFAGAVAIYYLGEWIDDGWEWLKKQIFE